MPVQKLVCWGREAIAERVPDYFGDLTDVSLGKGAACAVTEALGLDCWGDDRLINNTPIGCFLDGAVAEFHTCAVSEHHQVICWGNEVYAEDDPRTPDIL